MSILHSTFKAGQIELKIQITIGNKAVKCKNLVSTYGDEVEPAVPLSFIRLDYDSLFILAISLSALDSSLSNNTKSWSAISSTD
jgi:hypothetical protein